MKVTHELQYDSEFKGLEAYSNTPNPASQLASGSTPDKLQYELNRMHANLASPEWVDMLAEYL
jgi:hypothetical protein